MEEVRADFARWPEYQKEGRTWRISPPHTTASRPQRVGRLRQRRIRLAARGEPHLQELDRALRQREAVDALVLGDEADDQVGGGAGRWAAGSYPRSREGTDLTW